MGKNAIVSWNAKKNEFIKRDLLFFDNLYYDTQIHNLRFTLLSNITRTMSYDPPILKKIQANVDYLTSKGILKEFQLSKIKTSKEKVYFNNNIDFENALKSVREYDNVHTKFIEEYEQVISGLKKNYTKHYLDFINLSSKFEQVAEYHSRVSSCILAQKDSANSFIPICDEDTFSGLSQEKEHSIIYITISHFPVPNENYSIQDVIDFRNDSDNRRRYLGLINWLNGVVNSSMNINQINEQLEYFTVEFEHKMKLAKESYNYGKLMIVATLPLSIAEHLLKLEWSKIPQSIIQIRQNKLKLLMAEGSATGKEIAYIHFANEKFKIS
ncbi:hypothetical protein WAF17_10740 [Bernardetia sp. ABR2-2B]|uniref:hypothetical protein n=1 Tax=Bernardetia sp. ABR2-2B TaxID=3127472 RepID=UPI0030CDCFE7